MTALSAEESRLKALSHYTGCHLNIIDMKSTQQIRRKQSYIVKKPSVVSDISTITQAKFP